MYKSIFITYNQNSTFGQNTALRLQTISNLYGLSVFLPARLLNQSTGITKETERRINQSSIVAAFGLENLTLQMQAELSYAIARKKPIIVIYDKGIGRTVDFGEYKNKQEIHTDFLDTENALHEIARFLGGLPAKNTTSKKDIGVAEALLGVGLGLLALWALSKSE
ncbi:MAG: hypothetical protein HY842_01185 [Bacteroidetes bacterium]|nr:hypothetical protein [Bacteroidota bacterium]